MYIGVIKQMDLFFIHAFALSVALSRICRELCGPLHRSTVYSRPSKSIDTLHQSIIAIPSEKF